MKHINPEEFERKQRYVRARDQMVIDTILGIIMATLFGCGIGFVISVLLP